MDIEPFLLDALQPKLHQVLEQTHTDYIAHEPFEDIAKCPVDAVREHLESIQVTTTTHAPNSRPPCANT